MRIMRWLTGVAALAFGRGRAKQAGDDGCPCSDCREAARAAAREACAAGRVRFDGYAQAEADIAAWLRQRPRVKTYEVLGVGADEPRLVLQPGLCTRDAELIAAGVERGDHRPGDRSERCADCGKTTADGRGRRVLRTTDGYCDSCMEAARWTGGFPRKSRRSTPAPATVPTWRSQPEDRRRNTSQRRARGWGEGWVKLGRGQRRNRATWGRRADDRKEHEEKVAYLQRVLFGGQHVEARASRPLPDGKPASESILVQMFQVLRAEADSFRKGWCFVCGGPVWSRKGDAPRCATCGHEFSSRPEGSR